MMPAAGGARPDKEADIPGPSYLDPGSGGPENGSHVPADGLTVAGVGWWVAG